MLAWRPVAAFAVKAVHSIAFLGIAASVIHIFWAGVANRRSRLTGWAIVTALGECAIFALNGFRCPLRTLAENLGAESGQVTDIFLPRWLANRIPWIFTPLLVIGVGGMLWHSYTCRLRHGPSCGSASTSFAVRGRGAAPSPPNLGPGVAGSCSPPGCSHGAASIFISALHNHRRGGRPVHQT